MRSRAPSRPWLRGVLITLLVVAVIVLGLVAAILIPILTHESAGSSGQAIPDGYVTESTATGEDGRTRTLEVRSADGEAFAMDALEPGDQLLVSGTGFNSEIGIYVGICRVPELPDEKPGPCLGGIPDEEDMGQAVPETTLATAWVTNDWAWRNFATHQYEHEAEGSFSVVITVPDPVSEGLDCRQDTCAVTTRADHTAGSDRVQDLLLPIAYRTA